jgi:hypothetical protein
MMKSLSTIMAISTPALALFIACNNESKTKDANSYFARVIAKTDEVVNVFNTFIQRSTYNQIDSMRASNTLLEKTALANIDTIGKMEDYNGKAILKQEATEYIKALQDINNNEFRELIRLYSIPEDKFTESENLKIDSVSNSLDVKMSALSNRFLKAQTAFAKENNIKLNFNYELDSTIKKGVDTSVIMN